MSSESIDLCSEDGRFIRILLSLSADPDAVCWVDVSIPGRLPGPLRRVGCTLEREHPGTRRVPHVRYGPHRDCWHNGPETWLKWRSRPRAVLAFLDLVSSKPTLLCYPGRLLLKQLLFALFTLPLIATASAEGVPHEIWGKWAIVRLLPTTTIGCEPPSLIGTSLEYAASKFRWKDVVTVDPAVQIRWIDARQYQQEHSGGGAVDSYLDFKQLGVTGSSAMVISIDHPPASIMSGTIEIPGDTVLVKSSNEIVVTACGFYFLAKRAP